MVEPPFLELEYYLGRALLETAIQRLVDGVKPGIVPKKLAIRHAVGLSEKMEELEVFGGVVVLRTEGEMFCGPNRDDRARLRKLGRRVWAMHSKTRSLPK